MELTTSVKVKDRILFKEGSQVQEGVVMEISPSRKHMKIQYSYVSSYIIDWYRIEAIEEILGEE